MGIDKVVDRILDRRGAVPENRSLLVGISGIDACGKGYVARQLEAHLAQYAVASAVLNVDGWLNLPDKRFNEAAPAEHFYAHAIRFNELFSELLMPLRDNRSIRLIADLADETAASYRKHLYEFKDVGVILVEGIFLFKPEYRELFDLTIWIDCSFPTALARAIDRGQEGLSASRTIAAYETIYFPAQRIHLAQDKPRENANLILENDCYRVRRFRSRARYQVAGLSSH